MKFERRLFVVPFFQAEPRKIMPSNRSRQSLFKILFSHLQRLLGRLGLWRMKLGVVGLVQRDAILGDVHEEVATVRQTVVHFLQGVDDEVDRRSKRLGDAKFLVEPVFSFGPIFDAVGNVLPVDDDEQIEVGLIALGGMWFVDPATTRVAAVQNDLEDSTSLALAGGERLHIVELFEQDLQHAFEFALLVGRKMIEVSSHRTISLAKPDSPCTLYYHVF